MTLLAIYDMDETITRRPTFLPWIWYWATRHAPWRLPLLLLLALSLLLFVARVWDRARLKAFGQRLLMGRPSRAAVARAAEGFAALTFANNVHADALASIAADRAEGRRLVMATASFDFYVAAIARRAGIDDVLATLGRWDADRLHPGVDGENCYDLAKLARVQAFMAAKGIDRAAAHVRFYSDHLSDIPSFDWADEAVAVNPSPPFAAIAHKRGWRVARWT